MSSFSFTVPGVPVAKARPRFNGFRRGCYTPKKTSDYERLVGWKFWCAGGQMVPDGIPVTLTIKAIFPMPKNAPKKDRERLERPKTTRPDLDNIIKCACDALNGIAWKDDGCVSAYNNCQKIESLFEPPSLHVIISW